MIRPYSVLLLSTLVSTSAFAGLVVTPAPGSTSTLKTNEFTAKRASKPVLMTVELVGGMNKISTHTTSIVTSGSTVESQSSDGSVDGKSGAQGLAIGATMKPSERLGIEGNLAYIAKKFDSSTSDGKTDSANSGYAIFSTVRATAMARYYPVEGFSIGAGAYVSEFVGDLHGKDENGQSQSVSYAHAGYNRLDFGPAVGARGEIPLAKNIALTLDARYFYGLANLIDEQKLRDSLQAYYQQAGMTGFNQSISASMHTRDLQFGAGIGYRF